MIAAWWCGFASAGTWTKELGEVYVKAHADAYGSVRYVAPGTARADGSYLGQQYGVYAEAGIVPGWRGQLALAVPLVIGTHHAVYDDPFGTDEVRATTVRSGDLRVAAQIALHRRLPLALSADAKIPTYANGTVGDAYPVYRTLFPKPGDGQVDLGAMLHAGASLGEHGFGEAAVGFVHRTETFVGWDTDLELTDGVRFAAKAGRSVGRLLPILAVDGVVSPRATRYTRSVVTLSGLASLDVGRGVALEARVGVDAWVRNGSQGLGAGLGLAWSR